MPFSYQPPTDWPSEGMLLRPPQMVWITCSYVDSTVSAYSASVTWADTIQWIEFTGSFTDPQTIFWGSFCGEGGAFFGVPEFNMFPNTVREVNIWSGTAANGYADEYNSMLSLAEEVKSAIESIRLGKTWVLVNQSDFPGGTSVRFGNSATVAPHNFPDDYFGTSFLHIHIGSASEDSPISGPNYHAPSLVNDQEIADIKQAIEKFSGFYVFYFSPSAAMGQFSPSGTSPDCTSSGASTPPGYTRVYLPLAVPPDVRVSEQMSAIGLSNSYMGNRNASVANYYTMVQNAVDQYYPGLVVYMGDSSSLSVDSLVGLISSHFRFDPNTGAEIGG